MSQRQDQESHPWVIPLPINLQISKVTIQLKRFRSQKILVVVWITQKGQFTSKVKVDLQVAAKVSSLSHCLAGLINKTCHTQQIFWRVVSLVLFITIYKFYKSTLRCKRTGFSNHQIYTVTTKT